MRIPLKKSGWTMVELIIVLSVLAIVAMIFFARYDDNAAVLDAAAQRVESDVNYVRNRSISTSIPHGFEFNVTGPDDQCNYRGLRKFKGGVIALDDPQKPGGQLEVFPHTQLKGVILSLANGRKYIYFDHQGNPYQNDNKDFRIDPAYLLNDPVVINIKRKDRTRTVIINPFGGGVKLPGPGGSTTTTSTPTTSMGGSSTTSSSTTTSSIMTTLPPSTTTTTSISTTTTSIPTTTTSISTTTTSISTTTTSTSTTTTSTTIIEYTCPLIRSVRYPERVKAGEVFSIDFSYQGTGPTLPYEHRSLWWVWGESINNHDGDGTPGVYYKDSFSQFINVPGVYKHTIKTRADKNPSGWSDPACDSFSFDITVVP